MTEELYPMSLYKKNMDMREKHPVLLRVHIAAVEECAEVCKNDAPESEWKWKSQFCIIETCKTTMDISSTEQQILK